MRSPWNGGSISLRSRRCSRPSRSSSECRPSAASRKRFAWPDAQLVGIAGEDLADRGRVGEDHDRRQAGEPEGERVAVAALPLLEHLDRPPGPPQHLADGRLRRSRREAIRAHADQRPTAPPRPQECDGRLMPVGYSASAILLAASLGGVGGHRRPWHHDPHAAPRREGDAAADRPSPGAGRPAQVRRAPARAGSPRPSRSWRSWRRGSGACRRRRAARCRCRARRRRGSARGGTRAGRGSGRGGGGSPRSTG